MGVDFEYTMVAYLLYLGIALCLKCEAPTLNGVHTIDLKKMLQN